MKRPIHIPLPMQEHNRFRDQKLYSKIIFLKWYLKKNSNLQRITNYYFKHILVFFILNPVYSVCGYHRHRSVNEIYTGPSNTQFTEAQTRMQEILRDRWTGWLPVHFLDFTICQGKWVAKAKSCYSRMRWSLCRAPLPGAHSWWWKRRKWRPGYFLGDRFQQANLRRWEHHSDKKPPNRLLIKYYIYSTS